MCSTAFDTVPTKSQANPLVEQGPAGIEPPPTAAVVAEILGHP